MHNSTNRFADRVKNYVKYRPSYPSEFVTHLISEKLLDQDSVVADVGSGTGLSAKPLLENGNLVYGIEPNEEMRKAGEQYLAEFNNFRSVDAIAENTGLESKSIDLIVAGQAFHWFDRRQTRREFKRILTEDGTLLLMWNERMTETNDFLRDYEHLLLQHATDYREINHVNITPEIIADFFAPNKLTLFELENVQTVNYDGLEGRLMSCSYVPNYNESGHREMITDLKKLFEKHEQNGRVDFVYMVKMYHGDLSH